MRDMRDSEIKWIGAMPSAWKIARVKNVAETMQSGGTPDSSNDTYYVDSEGGIPWVAIADMSTTPYVKDTNKHISEAGRKSKNLIVFEPGTILYAMYASVGKVSELAVPATINQALLAIELNDSVNRAFFKYALNAWEPYIISESNGTTQFNLNANKVANLCFPMPSREEQEIIVSCLDVKCAQVDALIANVQAQIEKLKAYKQSVITEVVTKGLDPTVQMKDSGIVWIGEIPAHWEIAKLRTRTNMLTPMRDKPEDLSGPIPWVRIEDYCGKYITTSKEQLGVSADTVAAMNLKVYPVGTVLCTSSCDLGKCAIVGRELVSNQRFIGIIPQPELNADYLYYLMLSNAERLNTLSTGSIQANLSRVSFEQLLVQFPPMVEQKAISEYLDKKCEAADRLIAIKQAKIEKLEQYKRSIIYEYVTGKKEVC